MTEEAKFVWVFSGSKGRFPGGVFTSKDKADLWIMKHQLTGILTKYPLDEGTFDWAIKNNLTGLRPEKIEEKSNDADFLGSFTTAAQTHFHYENGSQE